MHTALMLTSWMEAARPNVKELQRRWSVKNCLSGQRSFRCVPSPPSESLTDTDEDWKPERLPTRRSRPAPGIDNASRLARNSFGTVNTRNNSRPGVPADVACPGRLRRRRRRRRRKPSLSPFEADPAPKQHRRRSKSPSLTERSTRRRRRADPAEMSGGRGLRKEPALRLLVPLREAALTDDCRRRKLFSTIEGSDDAQELIRISLDRFDTSKSETVSTDTKIQMMSRD